MAFICPVCRGEFTKQRNLVRPLKNHHGNRWVCSRCNQSSNRNDNYVMHERTCYFKATGKRKAESSHQPTKKQVLRTGGALEDTIFEYRLNLEDDEQNAPNVFDILKAAVLLMDTIEEEPVKKNAIKLYVSLHENSHLFSSSFFS